jgi:DNA (cytosine-5)-methyltransferase 1
MEWDVCELFAGVGGFRLGLEKSDWTVKFSSQWEPGASKQHASDCYVRHFGAADKKNKAIHSNEDIAKVTAKLAKEPDAIPDHDLLVGGFPCQDYSVATTKAKGMEGKKGVLWWEIHKILQRKAPRYVLLENVDRLLSSPAAQRGRDFGVILACLRDLGYAVEWRVINAADYGFPQKRRRTFIFAAHSDTKIGQQMLASFEPAHIIDSQGLFARAFPVEPTLGLGPGLPFTMTVQQVSDTFEARFGNAGVMLPGRALWTLKAVPVPMAKATLRSVLVKNAPEAFYVDQSQVKKVGADRNNWEYVKGAKREDRMARTGFKYFYTEGAIPFPDDLDQPSRTMLTGDGNRRPNRTGHIILDPQTKKYRVLTPVEAERLNGFPDDWTGGMPLSRRYFCMGNALVVGVVERLGKTLRAMVEDSAKGKQLIKQADAESRVA